MTEDGVGTNNIACGQTAGGATYYRARLVAAPATQNYTVHSTLQALIS